MRKLKGICFAILSLYAVSLSAVSDIFIVPGVSVYWNYDTSASVKITIYDISNSETGYRIYRDTNFTGSYALLTQVVSANPANHDTIAYNDFDIDENAWYHYVVVAYRTSDSIASSPVATFTLKSQQPDELPIFTKLGSISIADSSGWSAKAGDSIILRQNTDSAGKFSVINVQNPTAPYFAGYIDSATLISYPQSTLIPAYLKFGVSKGLGLASAGTYVHNFGDKILIARDSVVRLYKTAGSSIGFIDSVKLILRGMEGAITHLLQLNDTLVAVQFWNGYPSMQTYDYVFPLRISESGLYKDSVIQIGFYYPGLCGQDEAENPYVRGLINNEIIIPTGYHYLNQCEPGLNNSAQYIRLYDLNQKSLIGPLKGNSHHVFTANTGYYLSNTQFLNLDDYYIVNGNSYYLDAGHLWAEDIGDLDGYQTALSNSAVLQDTFTNLRNILLDTTNRKVFVLCSNNLSIYSYHYPSDITKCGIDQHASLRTGLRVIPSSANSGITIVLPQTSPRADLFFYDLSGKLVDKISALNTNAVVWRPKTPSMGCYIVSVKVGGELYSTKFMTKQ